MTTTIRVITLLLGGAALGMTLLISYVYHQAWRYVRPHPLVNAHHVALVGIAHMLLIVGLMSAILVRVRQNEPFTWWITPVACAGFTLTIVALVQLLRSHRLRELHAEVSAHIHSS